jgi:serine/threonine protein kinase
MLSSGTILQNRYRVVRVIGRGGMGAVYEAVDERLNGTVALKQTFFSDEVLGRAFEREARLLANLRHRALPRVSDHFVDGGGQFLVMEYIAGADLAELLRRISAPFDPLQVMKWTVQILDALEYLHAQEPPVIHRDIKPQNLKLTCKNEIVLLDFGLAKGAPQLLDPDGASSVFGYTLNYAPLEQIQNLGTDARSDLYSAGATLYNLLTGKTPPGSLSRAAAIAMGEADPLVAASAVNRKVSNEVAAVISRAMSLRSSHRYGSARLMLEALCDAQSQSRSGQPVFDSAAVIPFPESAPRSNVTVGGDPHGAVTRPAFKPVELKVAETAEVAKTPRFRWFDRPAKGKRTVMDWIYIAAGILCVVMPIYRGFYGSKPSEPPSTPPVASAPEGRLRTGTLVPGVPIVPTQSVGLAALDLPPSGLLTAHGGKLELRWKPVPDAVLYKIEIASADLQKTMYVEETENIQTTIQVSAWGKYVRILTVSKSGWQSVSRYWPINNVLN